MDMTDLLPVPDLLSKIQDPKLRRLYEYWKQRKADRWLPARRAIDPMDFPYILGSVLLIDALRDPLRFRVRVHGTDLVTRAGYDLTGKFLEDIPISDYRSYVIERCRGMVETGEAVIVQHDRVLDGKHRRYEALWLPFSDDDATVTTLLCALIYRDRYW